MKYTNKHAIGVMSVIRNYLVMPEDEFFESLDVWLKQVLMSKKDISKYLDVSFQDLSDRKISIRDKERLSFLMIFSPRKALNLILKNPMGKWRSDSDIVDSALKRMTTIKKEDNNE